jgi:hypothetical protein
LETFGSSSADSADFFHLFCVTPAVRLEFDHLVGAAVRLAALAHRHRENVSELELVGPKRMPAEHPGTV